MGLVAIPRAAMGTSLSEHNIRKALEGLNPNFTFDWGTKLNKWHPDIEFRQGVFYDGKHVCAMDRGECIPEVAVWSTKREMVRTYEPTFSEINDAFTQMEIMYGENGEEIPTGVYAVWRQVKDKPLFVGWRFTIGRIISKNFPGVTREALERILKVTIHPEDWDLEQEVPEGQERKAQSNLIELARA